MNITNHIFLPEAARRSVLVCLPSNTAINLRISRNTALSKAMKAVIPKIVPVTRWNYVNQSLQSYSPPSKTI